MCGVKNPTIFYKNSLDVKRLKIKLTNLGKCDIL